MADPFRVNCGSLNGLLYPDRYGPAGKSLCIKVENEDRWITPIDFERLAGKGSQHNWKRTLKSLSHDNKQLLQIIEEGVMSTCSDKSCNCSACEISRGKSFLITRFSFKTSIDCYLLAIETRSLILIAFLTF